MRTNDAPPTRRGERVTVVTMLRERAPELFAWLSLLLGVVGAWWMDHSPEHAPFVAAASVFACVAMFAYSAMMRADALQHTASAALPRWRAPSRWLVMTAMQSATQQVLFFATPFYARAACWLGLQPLFVAVLGTAAAVTLWSPSHQFILEHPILGALFAALALFAGLNVALPILGVGNAMALQAAYLAAASSAAALVIWGLPKRALHTALATAGVLCGWLLLQTDLLRAAIPPAPLRLVRAAIGERVVGLDLLGATERFAAPPASMTCFTEVWAPRGVREALVHTWYKDGVLVDTVALTVRGGAREGFRTWSVKQNLGERPGGTWRCLARTASGQVLGATQVLVGGADAGDG